MAAGRGGGSGIASRAVGAPSSSPLKRNEMRAMTPDTPSKTTIYKDIGPTTAEELMERHRNPDGTLDMGMLQDMHRKAGGIEEYFIKHSRHAQECEYRLLWATGQTVDEFIDIKVPDAIQFCRHVTTES
jgi:hypothetical protein